MDPFNSNTKKKTSKQKYQNFIEAFKDKGSSQQTDGAAKSEGQFDFESYLNQQELKIRQQERGRLESIQREEKIIFSREKKQVVAQIENIQVEIKALAKEQAGLMGEIDKAAFQAVVNPGVYHQNFFERLLHLIKLAKKNIKESRNWMQLHNHRSQKKSAYWQGVKKSGTSFMLSGERTASTQSG